MFEKGNTFHQMRGKSKGLGPTFGKKHMKEEMDEDVETGEPKKKSVMRPQSSMFRNILKHQ